MNAATAAAAVVLAALVFLAARAAHKRRLFGGCGGDCTACSRHCKKPIHSAKR